MATEAPANAPDKRDTRAQRVIGRYALYDEIASGGMAVVHFGRLLGPVGFARSVAIKRLHAHFAKDPEFVAMFLDEARLAARIRHPNVVPTIDVVAMQGELFLVMEYVQGDTVSRLVRATARTDARMPPAVAVSIIVGALHGLHAAHEARSERGDPLGIIHRDVSPQNILVGEDGVARIVDFGIAKASWRLQSTQEGQLKGKLPYMAPEQLREEPVDRRVDVYAAAVVLWELFAGSRLFNATNPLAAIEQMMSKQVPPPSKLAKGVSSSLDAIVLKGLARQRHERFKTAREMAIALEDAATMATPRQVGEWVVTAAGDELRRRAEVLSGIEHGGDDEPPRLVGVSAVIPELPASELSTSRTDVTVAGPIQPPPSPTRWRAPLGLAAAALFSLLAMAIWGGLRREPRERPEVSVQIVTAAVAPEPTPSTATAPPAPEVATVTDPPTIEESATPPQATAAPPEAARSPPSPRPPAARAVPTATAASASGLERTFPEDRPVTPPRPAPPASGPSNARPGTKVNCKPPYTVDAEGIRIPKPGCY